MPRTKSTTASAKPKTKKPVKKSTAKVGAGKKKSKPIIVDVIDDEAVTGLEELLDNVQAEDKNFKSQATKTFLEEEYIDDKEYDRDDLDQQKKFFSELVSKMKVEPSEEGVSAPAGKKSARSENSGTGNRNRRPSVGLYRRFVIKFVVLLGLLAAIVLYFCFSQLTVFVTPSGENINDNLLLKVETSQAADDESEVVGEITDPRVAVPGEIKEISVELEQIFPASGEEFTGEEIVGQVRVINNYSKSQALVATTRLLSPDNQLFRLKEAVNVPAGGEVLADIYAEKPSAGLAIGPTSFTIPGLWVGLQDKIYARSDKAFSFQQKIQKYVKSSDIERAVNDINAALIQKAKDEAAAALDTDKIWLYDNSEPATIVVEANAGDDKDEFLVKASGKITAISFSKEEAANLANAKLNLLVPDNKDLTDFQAANIIYTLENYDSETQSATIKASFSGTMVLKRDSEIINREKLVNLSADQIATYLKNQPEVKDYELKFSPSFVQKAPRLVDRIKIVTKE